MFLGLCAFAQPHLRQFGAGFIKAELWFDLRSDRQDAPPPQLVSFPRQALAQIYQCDSNLRDAMPREEIGAILCYATGDFLSSGVFASDLLAFLEETRGSNKTTIFNHTLALAIIALLYRPMQRSDPTPLKIDRSASVPHLGEPLRQLALVFTTVCGCVAAGVGMEDSDPVTRRHFEWARIALKATAAEVDRTRPFSTVEQLIMNNSTFNSMLRALSARTQLYATVEECHKCVDSAVAVISSCFANTRGVEDWMNDDSDGALTALRRIILRADEDDVRPPFSTALLAKIGGARDISEEEKRKYCEVLSTDCLSTYSPLNAI